MSASLQALVAQYLSDIESKRTGESPYDLKARGERIKSNHNKILKKLSEVLVSTEPGDIDDIKNTLSDHSSILELLQADLQRKVITDRDFEIVGERNGINRQFTLSRSFEPTTTVVVRNGLVQTRHENYDYIEVKPNKIRFTTPVDNGEILLVYYKSYNTLT